VTWQCFTHATVAKDRVARTPAPRLLCR
jgi:hypothetical protein